MSHIDFMLRTNPPVVSSHQDRVAWDHDGWAAMSDSMKDRLIRNLLILIGSSRMNTSVNHIGIAETVMIICALLKCEFKEQRHTICTNDNSSLESHTVVLDLGLDVVNRVNVLDWP